MTGSVHLYVNVTCFAAKHLKFDSRYTTLANITPKVYFIDLFFSQSVPLIVYEGISFRTSDCSIGVQITL